MKIKSVTIAMILALACAMVAPLSDAAGQTPRRSPRRKLPAKTSSTAAQAEPSESARDIEVKRQLDEIAKLSPEQKAKLKETLDLLQRVTRRVQLGDFPEYWLSEFGEGGKLEKPVNECLAFLPDGVMREALRTSLQALVDAWALDRSMKNGIVTDRDLATIDKYKLEGDSLYLMSREVLDIASKRAGFAAAMLELALK